MDISYRKDLNHNYLIIQSETEVDMEAYPVRMLLGNEIDVLIPCRIQSVNGLKEFCYDITSRQSVGSCLVKKKLQQKELKTLLQGFINAVAAVQAFLLDVNEIILIPDYMYYDEENTTVQFCYLPGYNKEIQTQFRGFMERLLPVIDHQDSEAVVIGYGVYRQSMEESFNLEGIKEFLYKNSEEKVEKDIDQDEINTQDAILQSERQEVIREFFDTKDEDIREAKEKAPWETIIISGVWTVVLLGTCALRYMGYLSFLTFPMLLVIFILVLGIIILNTVLWKKNKPKELSSGTWAGGNVAQASIQWPGKKVVESEEIQKFYGTDSDNHGEAGARDDSEGEEYRIWGKPDIGDTQPLPTLNQGGGIRLISKDPDKLADIELRGDLTIVGKLTDAVDVVIPRPTVSRVHAKLRRVDGEYYLMDLNSKNGTYINGKQISNQENCRIVQGDEISFADADYVFTL